MRMMGMMEEIETGIDDQTRPSENDMGLGRVW